MSTNLSGRLLWISTLAAVSLTLQASDGLTLIDQTGALRGKVTPGDSAGFPVTISESGSYRSAAASLCRTQGRLRFKSPLIM
jgi:hypothetical protein